MSDIKFSCPQCNQKISCDENWGGHQIACPHCQTNLIVPHMAAAPAPATAPASASLVPTPPTGGQTRLSLGQVRRTESGAPAPASTPVYRTFTPPVEKKSGVMKVIKIVVVVVAFGVGAYFGFTWILHVQRNMNAKMAEQAKNSDGGEAGHIAGIYQTLDMTDPEHPGMSSKDYQREKKAEAEEEAKIAAARTVNLSVILPTWTSDITAAQIPESRVNGMINGTNFLAETAQLDPAQGAQVLRFTEGEITAPEREILIYLTAQSAAMLVNKTITIAADTRAQSNPGIIKRWKTDPRYALQSKSYKSGYVLKLEIGDVNYGQINGKIYLALPDAEKTVIAGVFKAELPKPKFRGLE